MAATSVKVLHVIQALTLGGAGRAAIAAAGYSAQAGGFEHSILSLNPKYTDSKAVHLAGSHGVRVLIPDNDQERFAALAEADIVQVNWWNSPDMSFFLRGNLPAARMLAWLHVGGNAAPQVVTPDLIDYFDFVVACSPYTYECRAINLLTAEERLEKAGMAYGAADFRRLENFQARQHDGFNIGYIGTVDFQKMHPRYVDICAQVKIPEARFIVCGEGQAIPEINRRAQELGQAARFELRGYVNEIVPVLEILDLYAYPLCPDTYAASEINLQEVMYAGIPPVVFPYGGISKLVQHNRTGLVCNSEEEFIAAIHYLHQNPAERARLGRNARQYAIETFDAKIAAEQLNIYYRRVLQQPKRERRWAHTNRSDFFALPWSGQAQTAAQCFIESLGSAADPFLVSLLSRDQLAVRDAEKNILAASTMIRTNGIEPYAEYFSGDPYLQLWAGLAAFGVGHYEKSIVSFVNAFNAGLKNPRVLNYLIEVAKQVGNSQIVEMANQALRQFEQAGGQSNEI